MSAMRNCLALSGATVLLRHLRRIVSGNVTAKANGSTSHEDWVVCYVPGRETPPSCVEDFETLGASEKKSAQDGLNLAA